MQPEQKRPKKGAPPDPPPEAFSSLPPLEGQQRRRQPPPLEGQRRRACGAGSERDAYSGGQAAAAGAGDAAAGCGAHGGACAALCVPRSRSAAAASLKLAQDAVPAAAAKGLVSMLMHSKACKKDIVAAQEAEAPPLHAKAAETAAQSAEAAAKLRLQRLRTTDLERRAECQVAAAQLKWDILEGEVLQETLRSESRSRAPAATQAARGLSWKPC